MTRESVQEERFAQLQAAKQRRQRQSIERDGQTQRPKIQRVARHLRQREKFGKYYSPKLVSFGPIHHGENLELGEQYKLTWADMYIEDTKQSDKELYLKIAGNIKELRELYAEDVVEKYSNKDLTWILFIDGCSLLQIIRKADLTKPELLEVKVDILVLVQLDVLLLENQLPYQVLKLLCNDEIQLFVWMEGFLHCHHFQVPDRKNLEMDNGNEKDPTTEACDLPVCRIQVDQLPPAPNHLLDRLRTIVFGDNQHKKAYNNKTEAVEKKQGSDGCSEKQQQSPATLNSLNLVGCMDHLPLRYIIPRHWGRSKKQDGKEFPAYRNIQELKVAGIRVKRNKKAKQTQITFKSFGFAGVIYLSKLIVDETIAPGFLNLIAYEMCPDYKNDFAVSSYVAFLDSLIDHPDDVKDLRSAEVLHNALGSDEEVAELFNTIATDLVPDMRTYEKVRAQIDKHYQKIHLRWLNQVYSTHFSTPWAFIAFLAALLALVLTFIQTWFAVISSNKSS